MQNVSVVIPTWNRAHTLRAAIDSVLNQTKPVLEVLVCDDGSTDDSRAVVSSFPADKVKWVDGPRAGRPAIPRNRGIREAKGEWVAFLDSDDSWLPTKLDSQLELLALDETDACCTNAWRVVPGKGRVSEYLSLMDNRLHLTGLLRVNSVICSSAVVRKTLLAEVGMFPEAEKLKAIEDYALWLRISSRTDISYCGTPLVEYMDDAVNSVRSDAKENVQRENVMSDFYSWYCQQETPGHRSEVRKELRRAMKNNGRSFFERLKIK